MPNQSVEQQAISISYSLPIKSFIYKYRAVIKYIYPVIIRELHFTKFCQE